MFTIQIVREFTRLRIVKKYYIKYIGKITLTHCKHFFLVLIRYVLVKNIL